MPNIYPGPMGSDMPQVPVKDINGNRLPLSVIKAYVLVAMQYARDRGDQVFYVQQDGWGYSLRDIAPFFDYCPKNICLPYGFQF